MQKSQAIFPFVHDRTLKCNKRGESATVGFLDSYVEFELTHHKHIDFGDD